MNERKHVNIIGNIYIILGVLYLILAALIFFGFAGLGNIFDEETLEDVLNISGGIAATILIILGILNIIGGIGLKGYNNWARVLIIILSIIALLNFPIGTIIGVYALIVLFKPDTKALFYSGSTTNIHT